MEGLDKGDQGPISGCCAIEEEEEEDSRYQHRQAAYVSYLISTPPGFPGLSKWHIVKQR
jgi:hypothetical protein